MSTFTGRYVFVAGLHRTGTSLVANLIGQHPDVAVITQSPAPENEGCYLQGAIPHTARHGTPGQFATDPAQHHIEGSRYDTLEVQLRIASDWNRWFTPGGHWRVEKSPVNLTRMRLYQQLFPMSQFVVVLRHPEAMAAALAKWTDRSSSELIDYALAAYERALEDSEHLHAVLFVRYEDLVADYSNLTAKIDKFLSLKVHPRVSTLRNGNSEYSNCQKMSQEQTARARSFGYMQGIRSEGFPLVPRHPLTRVRSQIL